MVVGLCKNAENTANMQHPKQPSEAPMLRASPASLESQNAMEVKK